jgi:hypothetical protein
MPAMRRSAIPGAMVATLLSLMLVAACQNSSPGDGDACTAAGGVCDPNGACGETLAFPCPGTATCCLPVDAGPHGGDGGSGG